MTPRACARIIGTVAGLALAISSLAACGLQPSTRVVTPAGHALSASLRGPRATTKAAPAPSAPAVIGDLVVRAANLAFDQSQIVVASPGLYQVCFVNDDDLAHEIVFDDGTHLSAAPGASAVALVNIPAEGSAFLSAINAQRDIGMVGQVRVVP
ncbi:MAG: hypothetical protein HGA45_27395 [Chloroflexales bacterium]|nr:hypothetical protein [Chloroflexales bacterium]